MVQVCEGTKTKGEMLVQSIEQYKDMYVMAKREFDKVIEVSLFALLYFLAINMTICQSVRRYIERAGARNARNGENNGGPGRGGGGGGAPRSRGRGRGNDGGDHDDGGGGGAPPAGGSGRGRGAGARAPRKPPPPPSNAGGKPTLLLLLEGNRTTLDIDPPRPRPRSSLREAAPRAGPSNTSSSNQLPKCDCGDPAGKKRVTQKSAREGKQFYACAQGVCGFFKWVEGEYDGESQDPTRPAPLIPAKRVIGTSRTVSVINLCRIPK